MKHQVIGLKVHNVTVTVNGQEIKMKLPDGCTGILFCFESKKAPGTGQSRRLDVMLTD